MNHNDTPNTTDPTPDVLPPLDAFERAWAGKLSEPDPEYARSADAFVRGVLDTHEHSQNRPAVIGRIGAGRLPYAAAAAVLIAALIGWYVVTGNPASTSDSQNIAEQGSPNTTHGTPDHFVPQPDPAPPVATVDPTKIKLGKLIAQTQASVTLPATDLPQTVGQAPDALRMDRLLDLINSPLPDLKELLAPLKQDDDQQSRAWPRTVS